MKTRLAGLLFVTQLLFAAITLPAAGQEKFSKLVGPVKVQPVAKGATLRAPYITWGGDVATFHANGGLKTQAGSIYGKMGLKLDLTAGDDFIAQVKDYMGGKTPFLRGTFRMLGQASEVLGADPRTKPVVVLQLSWSQGDHIVSRQNLKTLNDLKGKRIACQKGGPHVGLLYDSLKQVSLNKDDVQIVWAEDLTGENGPAEMFRKDSSIDACCVITPDMIGLTGGLDSVGSGSEGTVKGARVLNSTQSMSRSITDVYAVRSDWFGQNKDVVKNFVAGYLKATEQVKTMRDDFEKTPKLTPQYRRVLKMSQDIFGKEVLPTLEVDAHGLLLDCEFARLPGQIAFFEGYRDQGKLLKDPNGFEAKMKSALDLAVSWGYADSRRGFDPSGFDYREIAKLADLKYTLPENKRLFKPAEGDPIDFSQLGDDNTIFSFEITFPPNEDKFSVDRYGGEFARAISAAGTFRNAVVVIRGHSDPSQTLIELLKAGMRKKILKRVGKQWYYETRPLALKDTKTIVELVKSGAFGGVQAHDPSATMQAALNLSKGRADKVRDVIVRLAREKGLALDDSRLQPVGMGISEPVVPVPTTREETAPNRRVEFRVIRVKAESIQEDDLKLLGGGE